MQKMIKIIEIPISPFSVNKAWAGRRYMTTEYKQWRNDMLYLLPKFETITGNTIVDYEFYLKNYGNSDYDNFVKTCQDSIVEGRIIEDDRYIKKGTAEKFKVDRKEDEKIIISIKKCID